MANGDPRVNHPHDAEGKRKEGYIQELQTDTKTRSSHCKRSAFAQCCATLVNSLSFVSLGLLVGTPIVVIETIHKTKGGLTLNDEQVSWYASLLPIFQPLGCFLGGVLQNYIGRKHGLLLMNISTTIAWILLYTAASAEILYASSILMGISVGFSEAPGLTYICEIATPRLRGILVTFNISTTVFGIMMTFLLATFMDLKRSCLFCMGLCVLSVFMLFFIPDSPIWLINKGRKEDAMKAIRWLRGWVKDQHVKEEFADLCRAIGSVDKELDQNNSSWKSRLKVDQLLHKSTLRPFVFLQCHMFFSCAAGLMGARNYLLVIFNSLNLPVDSTWLGFLIWMASLFGNIMCFILIGRLGKRQLSLVTMFLCSSLTLLMGLYISFQHELNQPWIFTILTIGMGFINCLGITTLPWVLLGEIYPVKVRSIATGLTGASYYFIISLFVKTYYYLQLLMGTQGTFILYSIVGFIGVFYVWFCMPETEGKTIPEIEELFFDGARTQCSHFGKKK